MSRRWLFLAWLIVAAFQERSMAAAIPTDFPHFKVPGHEQEMESLRALYWHHYEPAGPLIPLWDEWMPPGTLWPALGEGADLEKMRSRWAQALSSRPMNAQGYVLTQQHDGPAHAEGWPFPRWMDAGGIGWHFRGTGIPGYDGPPASTNGWLVERMELGEINAKGLILKLTGTNASAQTPGFSIEAKHAPWLRLNWWAEGLSDAKCYVEWTTKENPSFTSSNRAHFSAPTNTNLNDVETRTMIQVHTLPGWKGTITGLRLVFGNAGPAKAVIKSFHTACDTRQPINNSNLIRGSRHYFNWTGDIAFLRAQMPRLRTALRYMMSEFDTRRRKCVYTTWPGHEGRSGVHINAEGKKSIRVGEGIGGNYWDLLPFGGEDALATIYYYDAVLGLAELEEQILVHPEWNVPADRETFKPEDLGKHAGEVRDYGTRRFWNEKTGRFGTVDLDGVLHDYGFTFLNNEAIYYGFAKPAQAKNIRDWISGRRVVHGDTSTGADIYHWRFGPRSTTRRNLDYYYWGWSNPESVSWGYQVQDGGSVLGFSYHDLMARLTVEGPESAWTRLQEIIKWFDETQAAGGYREYYKDPARGTMQGGNVAGGLGLDREFFESILVPQVMINGFLGLRPTWLGFELDPHLPKGWPSLSISRIHLRDKVLEIGVESRRKTVVVTGTGTTTQPLIVKLPSRWKLAGNSNGLVITGK